MKTDNIGFAYSYVERNLNGKGPNEEYIIFEALIRRKDNVNPVLTNAHGDSLLIRAWYVDTPTKFVQYLPEMKYLCNITGARLYMNLDVKSAKKFSLAFIDETHDFAMNVLKNNQVSVKNTIKMPLSVLASGRSSVHDKRKILVDVDEPNEHRCEDALKGLIALIPEGVSYNILKTVNGAHLIIDRTGLQCAGYSINIKGLSELYDFTIKENAMTVVYFNNEDVVGEIN